MTLSIITINYNNAPGLQDTVESVIRQTFTDFEYLIIDGGSSDESIDVIKKYESKIDYWISEKDRGVYHAMNKGIVKAKGDYLLMLNSGDCLINNNVLNLVFGSGVNNEDILYGNVDWQKNNQYFTQSVFPPLLTFGFFWNKSLGHQAAFIKKTVHEKTGLYDESSKVISDWKFFVLAVCKYEASYKHVGATLALCDCTGLSWNSENFSFMKEEKQKVLQDYFPLFYDDYKELEAYRKDTFQNHFADAKQRVKQAIKQMLGYKKAPAK